MREREVWGRYGRREGGSAPARVVYALVCLVMSCHVRYGNSNSQLHDVDHSPAGAREGGKEGSKLNDLFTSCTLLKSSHFTSYCKAE